MAVRRDNADDADDFDLDGKPRKRRRRRDSGWHQLLATLVGSCLFLGCGAAVVGGLLFYFYDDWFGAKLRDKIVGKWEATLQERPLLQLKLDIRKDNTLTLRGINDAVGRSTTEEASWEVLKDTGDRIHLRIRFTSGITAEWELQLVSADEMRLRFLTSKSPDTTFKRKS